jgi:glycosyltransferase involved in cell wall biosynthesis
VSFRPLPVLETGSPNKFFDGLAAGKLIVLNFGGWLSDEIKKSECGIAVSPNDPIDLIDQIRLFINDRFKLKSYQESARKLADTRYSRKILSHSFLKLFN